MNTVNFDFERLGASVRHVKEAWKRIAPHVVRTPLAPSPKLSQQLEARVLLKLENLQTTGSFKLRGVFNTILSIPEGVRRERPLVAASTGNHGAAFAHALSVLGLSGRLFVPNTVSEAKRSWLAQAGVPLEWVGEDCLEAEAAARRYAAETDALLIPPYNHIDVVNGQGTVAVELLDDTSVLDAVFVPVGGGGLISGIGAFVKQISPETRIIGCQPAASAVIAHSVQAGRSVVEPSLPTLSDGTAGGVEAGSMTFDICRKVVDEFVLLSEAEIANGMLFARRHQGMDIEGAAALGIAAARKLGSTLRARRIAVIVSGGRVDPMLLDQLEERDGASRHT